jgi:hypothetical protein
MVAHDKDILDRFVRHFPSESNDPTEIVLKGHLLMEETINRMLRSLLVTPDAIEGANLRFHQKLCLLRALDPAGPHSLIFDVAEKLNTLRNRLAHAIDHPKMEDAAKDLLSLLEKPECGVELTQEPLSLRLRGAIIYACGMMEGWGDALRFLQDSENQALVC